MCGKAAGRRSFYTMAGRHVTDLSGDLSEARRSPNSHRAMRCRETTPLGAVTSGGGSPHTVKWERKEPPLECDSHCDTDEGVGWPGLRDFRNATLPAAHGAALYYIHM